MRATIASLIGLAGLAVATPVPSAVTSAISPSTTDPAGCSSSFSGTFEIEVVNVTSSSSKKAKRDTVLTLTLADGRLTDADGRTGYIASNEQFQFDDPPQAGAIYTSGWSACSNGTLALGSQTVFYECLSGTFYNLYATSQGAQCAAIYIEIINAGSGTAPVSQQSDGQPTGTPVTQITDGQPQATTGVPVTQISDGQIQATTGTPVTQISDGQVQATTGVAVTQISDGQVQATTATTAAPVTQISDGQVQATTGTPVTQISDGQIQATTATASTTSVAYNAAGKVEGGAFGLVAALVAVIAL